MRFPDGGDSPRELRGDFGSNLGLCPKVFSGGASDVGDPNEPRCASANTAPFGSDFDFQSADSVPVRDLGGMDGGPEASYAAAPVRKGRRRDSDVSKAPPSEASESCRNCGNRSGVPGGVLAADDKADLGPAAAGRVYGSEPSDDSAADAADSDAGTLGPASLISVDGRLVNEPGAFRVRDIGVMPLPGSTAPGLEPGPTATAGSLNELGALRVNDAGV